MKEEEGNIILQKSFQFSCDILDLHKKLVDVKLFRIADQVCGSGTSIGANVREAQRAVSKADFINKMGIALKEAEETLYWFELIDTKVLTVEERLKEDLLSIKRILISIINSSKN